MVLLIVLPFLLSYLILFTDYNSDSMLAFSAITVIVSLYALKGILHDSAVETSKVTSQSDKQNDTVVCRTIIRFVDCELAPESARGTTRRTSDVGRDPLPPRLKIVECQRWMCS